MIHNTAIVSSKAKIGERVQIGPFCVIEDDVEIGNDTILYNNVVLGNGTRLGANVKIFPFAVIGTAPQDLKYNNEQTFAIIGDDTVVREYATINRGTTATGKTTVGKNVLVMAYCHIAHDCMVGDNVVISNVTQLAGHVTVGNWVVIGGVAKIVQFMTIGDHAMIGADCKVTKDVAPYTLIGREPARVENINKIGLKRRGFSDFEIKEIEQFYDAVIFGEYNTNDGIKKYLESNGDVSKNVQMCIDFIKNSKKGICR